MKRLLTLALCFLFAFVAFAQESTPAESPMEVVLFSGAAFNAGGSPQVTGTLGGLYQFTPKTYGGLVADISFRKSGLPQTTIRGEVARQVLTINGLPIYALMDVGSSFAASEPSALVQSAGNVLTAVAQNVGTNVGYMAGTGVSTSFRLPFYKKLYALPSFRVVKGSLNDAQLVWGINFGAKVKIKKS
jgi:hypothetical protein